jgi:hypothetical protein
VYLRAIHVVALVILAVVVVGPLALAGRRTVVERLAILSASPLRCHGAGHGGVDV